LPSREPEGTRDIAAFLTDQAVLPKYGQDREDIEIRAVDAMLAFLAKEPVRADFGGISSCCLMIMVER